jgi:hypothetical protein
MSIIIVSLYFCYRLRSISFDDGLLDFTGLLCASTTLPRAFFLFSALVSSLPRPSEISMDAHSLQKKAENPIAKTIFVIPVFVHPLAPQN